MWCSSLHIKTVVKSIQLDYVIQEIAIIMAYCLPAWCLSVWFSSGDHVPEDVAWEGPRLDGPPIWLKSPETVG